MEFAEGQTRIAPKVLLPAEVEGWVAWRIDAPEVRLPWLGWTKR